MQFEVESDEEYDSSSEHISMELTAQAIEEQRQKELERERRLQDVRSGMSRANVRVAPSASASNPRESKDSASIKATKSVSRGNDSSVRDTHFSFRAINRKLQEEEGQGNRQEQKGTVGTIDPESQATLTLSAGESSGQGSSTIPGQEIQSQPGAYAQPGPGFDVSSQMEASAFSSSNDHSTVEQHSMDCRPEEAPRSASDLNRTLGVSMVEANPVSDVETILQAKDVRSDHYRRNILIIVVIGIIACATIVTFAVIYAPRRGGQSDDDPRCLLPSSQQIVPIQCLCSNSSEPAWNALNETGMSIYESLLTQFRDEGIIERDIVLNRTGCQSEHQALLSVTTGMLVKLSGEEIEMARVDIIQEVYVLAHLFVTLDGVNWNQTEGWFQAEDYICEWFGIDCVFFDTVGGVSLPSNGLRGTIPTTIQHLSSLRKLDLSGNEGLTGQIPSVMGSMTALRLIDVSGSHMSGEIPSELGGASRLEYFDITDCEFEGHIPSNLFRQWSNLRAFLAGGNELSGRFPTEIGLATHVADFIVDGNRMTGPLPSELGLLHRLELLQISGNEFTGLIPPQLANGQRFEFLNAFDSGLTGPIPESFCSPNVVGPRRRRIILDCESWNATCSCCSTVRSDPVPVFIQCGSEIPDGAGLGG